MAAPTVSSTSPVTGSTDFSPSASLSAVFSTALQAASVNRGTVMVYETATGREVDVDLHLSADGLIVTIIPRSVLQQTTNYTFALVGNDIGAIGCIKSSDGDSLQDTYNVLFRTTTERFVSLTEIARRSDIEGVGPIRDVEDAAQVEGVIAIDSVTPAAFATNQSRTISTIVVDFGEAVHATGSGSALSVTMSPADGMTRDYGHEDATGKFLYRDVEDTASRLALITDPVGVVSFVGDTVVWTKDSAYTFPYNAQITVQIHADRIANADGYMMEEDVYFSFTTQFWPVYGNPTVLRIELGPTISQLYDDTLYRIMFKNSIRAILEADDAAGTTRDKPYPNTERFVKAQSVIDVIDQIKLLADIQSGQSKSLGDFRVEYRGVNAEMITKRKEAAKERDKALRELRYYRGQSRPRTVVQGIDRYDTPNDFGLRTWDSLVAPSIPIANTSADRAERAQLRTDHMPLGKSRRIRLPDDSEVHVEDGTAVRVLII